MERQRRLGSGAQTGDEEFDTYFRTVYRPIVRALSAVYGDPEAAAAATQDAFLHAYVRWRRVRRCDSPVAWIRRDAIRRLGDDGDRWRDTERGSRSAPSELGTTLAALPIPIRTAVVLTYLEDLPEVEVARSMGVTEAAVRAHLDRGLACLTAAMASADGGDG